MKTRFAILVLVVFVSLVLTACGGQQLEYMAVAQGQDVGFSEKSVTIIYGDPSIARLQMRTVDTYFFKGDTALRYVPDEFTPGKSAERMTGEVVEMKIYHLTVDPGLGESITVGVYLTASPTVNLRAERIGELVQGSEIYGIPVITWDAGIAAHQQAAENSVNTLSDVPNLKTFIQGWAVGHLLEEDQFLIIGYVPGDVFQEK